MDDEEDSADGVGEQNGAEVERIWGKTGNCRIPSFPFATGRLQPQEMSRPRTISRRAVVSLRSLSAVRFAPVFYKTEAISLADTPHPATGGPDAIDLPSH